METNGTKISEVSLFRCHHLLLNNRFIALYIHHFLCCNDWLYIFCIECPTGYTYIGDDGTPVPESDSLTGSYWYLGESPTYSCYKNITVTDINDALGQCYKSVMDSDQMEARVVSFDDENEKDRVFNNYFKFSESDDVEMNQTILTFLTSGMKFADGNEDKWIYLGTSMYLVRKNMEI